jgi:hypothetical protein
MTTKPTNSTKFLGGRRITTFSVLAFTFAFLWLLLAPIFSYEPGTTDFFSPPGTELAIFHTP